MLSALWRIFRRLAFLLVLLFVALNALTYLVLNSPFIQRRIVAHLNERYLAVHHLELSLESLSVDFVRAAFNLNGVGLRVTDESPQPFVRLTSAKVGLAPLRTYIKRAPVLTFVRLDGAELKLARDAQGRIVWPLSRLFPRTYDTPDLDVLEAIRKARALLPPQIEFADIHVRLGDPASRNHQAIGLRQLVVKNPGEAKAREPMLVVAELGPSRARWPALEADVTLSSLSLSALLYREGMLEVERLETKGGLGELEARGEVRLHPQAIRSGYSFKAKTKADFGALMGLFGMQAAGSVTYDGNVDSTARLSDAPRARGRVTWTDAALEGWALHSGRSQVIFQDMLILHGNTEIMARTGGTIRGSGRFGLTGEFPFTNDVSLSDFKFTELMAGLTVKTRTVEFDLGAERITVAGRVRLSDRARVFELTANGGIQASSLTVPSLHSAARQPLGPCRIALALSTDAKTLDFKGSTVSCRSDGADLTTVDHGRITYATAETRFNARAKNFDFRPLEYFLGSPTQGVGDFTATLQASQSRPLSFSADLVSQSVLLYGVDISTLNGRIEVDGTGVRGSGVTAIASSGQQSAVLKLERFQVEYENVDALFVGQSEGELAPLMRALHRYLPEKDPTVAGRYRIPAFALSGPLMHPSRWDLTGLMTSEEFSTLGFTAGRLELNLDCKEGTCRNSRLVAHPLRSNFGSSNEQSAPAPQGAQPEPLQPTRGDAATQGAHSYIFLDLESLSFDGLDVRGELRRVPVALNLSQDGETRLSTLLDARVSLRGPWDRWEGSLQVTGDDLRLGERRVGPVSLSALSHGGGDVNVVGYMRYQQLLARMRFPHQLRGPTSVYLRTRSLDLSFLMPPASRAKHNVFTSIDGEMTLDGELGAGATLAQWRGRGRLQRVGIQFKQIELALRQPTDLALDKGTLTLDQARLSTAKGNVNLEASYNLLQGELAADVDAGVSLDILQDISNRFGTSTGRIQTSLELFGPPRALQISGEAKVAGEIINLKEFSPPLTNIQGEANFDGDKVEVRNFRANKGEGQLELVGSVNWAKVISEEQENPALALKLTARQAQIRLPVPVLETFDTVLDGNVELIGDTLPYQLNGTLRIVRSRAAREITCTDVVSRSSERRERELSLEAKPFANLNVAVSGEESISIQTPCLRGRLSANVRVAGTTEEPSLAGTVGINAGTLNLLKSRFEITKADLVFDNPVRIDPKLDFQAVARIENYRLYLAADGTLRRPRTNLWADPSVSPDGAVLTQADMLRMLSSGQAPRRTTSQTTGQAFASQVAGYVYDATSLDESLSQALSRLTGGYIDDVQLQPVIENGQTRWKARVSRSLGERFNLGLDIEQSPQVNNQSLTGTLFVNESVNVLGGFDRRSSQATGSYSELSGGLRFQFGSSK